MFRNKNLILVTVLLLAIFLVDGFGFLSRAEENDYPVNFPMGGMFQDIGGYIEMIEDIYSKIPGLEITEEQAKNIERLLKMPTGKMNDDIWIEVLSQISCLALINEKTDEAKMEELVKPYGVTFEEWAAYHWQTLIYRPAVSLEKIEERLSKEKMEELKKNNCRLKKELVEEKSKMTDEIWMEIYARIKCIGGMGLGFSEGEIETIFKPFGVTPVEFYTYTEDIIKRMEKILEKSDEEWTEEDWALGELATKLKQRIEELKKNNCVLEDGTPISKEYNRPIEPELLEAWDKVKCKLLTCDNCYKVTEDSSWWAKYRCRNLCVGCPSSPPQSPPVENCLGFCSAKTCPAYADKISGDCAPQKKCRRCGPFKIFKCCQEVTAVCCLTKPAEVCQGFCALESCPEGTVSAGEKNCPSGKKCRRCWIFAKCCDKVPGVCCMSP